MRKFIFILAALCCAFTFLMPQKAQAGKRTCVNGVYYYTANSNIGGNVSYDRNSDDPANYYSLSGDVYIAAYVTGIGEIITIEEHAFRRKQGGGMINVILPSTIQSIGNWAFYGATKLYSIQLNEGLTKMGISAFYGCTSLASITFPSTLKEIPQWAFEDCTSLATVAFSSGVEHIDNSAFEGCTALQSVKGKGGLNRNNNIKTIGEATFRGCTSLSDMRFSSTLTSIGQKAFYDCVKLENVNLPSSLSTIGEFAFANSGLKTLTVNWTTPLTIYANVFEGVILSQCILYVPAGTKNAYKNAEVWKKFGQILEPGEEPAEPITVGKQKIGNFWYELQEDLRATLLRHEDYKSLSGAITIPASVTYGQYTYTVNEIQESVFYECSQLTEVTLPNTITEIPQHAFRFCSGLTKVTLPTALSKIGLCAFQGCSALSNISFPATLTEIEGYAFCACRSLTSVSIPSGVKILSDWCFDSCEKLSKVTLSEGLTTINEYAFAGCTALKTLVLPASMTTMGAYVFNANSNMVSLRSKNQTPPTAQASTFSGMPVSTCILYVPAGTKDAYAAATGWKAFANIQEKGVNERIKYGKLYYQLEENGTAYVTYETQDANNYKDLSGEITVEDKISYKGLDYKVYKVDKNALRNCKGITKVNLPLIMDYILDSAFYNCSNLAAINLPTTMTLLYSTALENTKLFNDNQDANGAVYYDGCMIWGPKASYSGDYVVKEGTRLIATDVFADRDYITSLTFPEGVQCICMSAVYRMTRLKTLSLPSTLYSIGSLFCASCTKLTTIYNYIEDPIFVTGGFNMLNKDNCTLYVPKGSKAAYEETSPWKNFPIVEMNGVYNVTFADYSGFEIKTEKVPEGEDAHAPAAPEVEGYYFIGWDAIFTNVQEDMTVNAQYERKQFTVRFLDGLNENAPIDEQQVYWGQSALAPEPVPEHEGYIFIGWDKEFDIVTSDLDVIAQYDQSTGVGQIDSSSLQGGDRGRLILRNGQLLILRGEKVYTVTGQEVR